MGRNEGVRMLDEIVCQAVQSVPAAGKGHNMGVRMVEEALCEAKEQHASVGTRDTRNGASSLERLTVQLTNARDALLTAIKTSDWTRAADALAMLEQCHDLAKLR